MSVLTRFGQLPRILIASKQATAFLQKKQFEDFLGEMSFLNSANKTNVSFLTAT